MLDYLIHLTGRIGNWAYLLVFLGATLESAAFLGLLIPGESLVLVAGFLAAQQVLDLDGVIVVVAIGAVLGDSIGYEMGRHLGRPALERYGPRLGLDAARIERADAFFARHGGKSVFLGRFVGFARALVPFMAGASRMPLRTFLPYNVSGAVLWSVCFVLLGYFLGAGWQGAQRWIGRASAVLGLMVLLLVVLGWLWRWAVRHERWLKDRAGAVLQRPGMLAWRRRYARPIAFVQARLSPDGYLGLQLTVGAVVLTGFAWLFGGIAEDVVTGDPLTVVDLQLAQWFHSHAAPALTSAMLVISNLHGVLAISSFVAVTAAVLAWRRHWSWLLILALTVPGGMLINVLMKLAFQRGRPSFEQPLLVITSYSFPSGHVAGATLFYGFLVAIFVTRPGEWSHKVMAVLAATALIALVALSRMYLGVHYLSDVLAAFAEAAAWLTLCLVATRTWSRYRTGIDPLAPRR